MRREPSKYPDRLWLLVIAIVVIAALLVSGCAKPEPSGTESLRETHRQLWSVRPSYSKQDTDQTKEEGALFYEVWLSLCPPDICVVGEQH